MAWHTDDIRDDWTGPHRRGGEERPAPSSTKILIGIGICVGAAMLFVVGMIILVRAVSNRAREGPGPNPGDSGQPLTLESAIRFVKQGEVFEQEKAARFLAGLEVDPGRRAEVVAALQAGLDNRLQPGPRQQLFDTFAKWATAADTPYFLRLMDDDDGNIKIKAMHALAKLKDPRGVDPVAQRLADGGFRRFASQALKDMGPMAEKAVAEYLHHPDFGLRIEACNILKVIGVKESRATLVKLAWDDHPALAQAARAALPPRASPAHLRVGSDDAAEHPRPGRRRLARHREETQVHGRGDAGVFQVQPFRGIHERAPGAGEV